MGGLVQRPMRILVLGAGFGGLELTTRLSDELGDDVDIVLIDKADGFVFGFSKLDVMFGRTTAQAVRHSYHDLVKPGVRFVQTTVRSIDPVRRQAGTDAGPFEADRPARPTRHGAGLRRQGNLLDRVRSRPGRPRRGNFPQRRTPERPVRRAVRPAIGGQGRLRDQPHTALVRPCLDQLLNADQAQPVRVAVLVTQHCPRVRVVQRRRILPHLNQACAVEYRKGGSELVSCGSSATR
jgi:hypothetical protein